jgi:hypothetical protein
MQAKVQTNMTKQANQKLTLYQPVRYEIKIPGKLDEQWLDWNGGILATIETDRNGDPIIILNLTVDQAGLQGLLRYLYSLGLPLISVLCVDWCRGGV